MRKHGENHILLVGIGKRHEGMYRLPRRPAEFCATLPHLTDQKYSITRYKVTRHLYRAPADTAPLPGEEFIPLSKLAATPMASPDRKLVNRYAVVKGGSL